MSTLNKIKKRTCMEECKIQLLHENFLVFSYFKIIFVSLLLIMMKIEILNYYVGSLYQGK